MTIKEAIKGNGTKLGIMACSGMIKKAETMLTSNETVEFACVYNVYTIPSNGDLKVNTGISVKNKTAGVTVLTNRRIFFCSTILGNVNSKQIKLEDIQSVDYKTLMGLSTVRVKGLTDMIIIEATKRTAEELYRKINELQERNESSNRVQNQNNFSSADEILKFKQLLDQGIITQEEFERKKNELL